MKHWSLGLPLVSLLPLTLAAPLSAHPCLSLSAWHLGQNGVIADFTPPVGVFGLWRPGSGAAFAPVTGIPEGELGCHSLPCLVDNPGDGRSVADFERYRAGNAIYYALTFAAGEKDEALLPSLQDETALEQETLYQEAMGRRLTDFETYLEGGYRRWAALFQQGGTTQELAFGLSSAQLESRVASPHPRMRRLVDFELTRSTLDNRYAALFDGSAAEQRFYAELSVEEFHLLAHQLRNIGYRLQDAETWVEMPSGEMRFAALFERASGDDHIYALACDRVGLACSSPSYFAEMEGHMIERTLQLHSQKPSLRLLDIEFPRGAEQLPISSLTGGARTGEPASRESASYGDFDPPITSPAPTHCNHAGVLHDAGTNGPP